MLFRKPVNSFLDKQTNKLRSGWHNPRHAWEVNPPVFNGAYCQVSVHRFAAKITFEAYYWLTQHGSPEYEKIIR